MELISGIAFVVGCLGGGLLFGFGVVVGMFLDSGVLRRKPKEEEYNPDDAPMNDEFFDRAMHAPEDGGHEFPTDKILEELHRHSSYEVTND